MLAEFKKITLGIYFKLHLFPTRYSSAYDNLGLDRAVQANERFL